MNAFRWHIWLLLGVALIVGCAKKSTGTLGAASVEELVDRYKQAHRSKDIEALRSIHFLYLLPADKINIRIGSMGHGETIFPDLFELELEDVEVVELPFEHGAAALQYVMKRVATPENGFRTIRMDTMLNNDRYKLVLLGRRPTEVNGPLMEVDASIGVCTKAGRFYLLASSSVAESVAEWVKTGRHPWFFRPPDHKEVRFNETPSEIPAGWVSVVRRRPAK